MSRTLQYEINQKIRPPKANNREPAKYTDDLSSPAQTNSFSLKAGAASYVMLQVLCECVCKNVCFHPSLTSSAATTPRCTRPWTIMMALARRLWYKLYGENGQLLTDDHRHASIASSLTLLSYDKVSSRLIRLTRFTPLTHVTRLITSPLNK